MNKFPKLPTGASTLDDILDWIRNVTGEREKDVVDTTNYPNIFLLGRNRTLLNNRNAPSSSSDVLPTDVKGDIMWDANYLYILLDAGSGLEWRRASVGSF